MVDRKLPVTMAALPENEQGKFDSLMRMRSGIPSCNSGAFISEVSPAIHPLQYGGYQGSPVTRARTELGPVNVPFATKHEPHHDADRRLEDERNRLHLLHQITRAIGERQDHCLAGNEDALLRQPDHGVAVGVGAAKE